MSMIPSTEFMILEHKNNYVEKMVGVLDYLTQQKDLLNHQYVIIGTYLFIENYLEFIINDTLTMYTESKFFCACNDNTTRTTRKLRLSRNFRLFCHSQICPAAPANLHEQLFVVFYFPCTFNAFLVLKKCW